MKDHIEISLEWEGRQADLAVPVAVTAPRLVELLSQAFKAKNQKLPEQWHFSVKGKSVALESGLTLKELGLGNGEIFQIVLGDWDEFI